MNSIEIWKEVVGYRGYEVSSWGNVRSYRKRNSKELYETPTLLKHIPKLSNKKHYLSVRMASRWFLIHRLVAVAFIPNHENKAQVNHKDNNPLNNKVDNLEWNTCRENIIHSFKYRKKNGSLVLDTINGVYYDSIPEAAKYNLLNSSSLRAMLIGTYRNKTGLTLV